MSILSRVKISPQQRYDLEDFFAQLSAQRTDSKLWTQKFLSEANLVLGGFTVTGIGLNAATVGMANAALILPQGTSDFSYFVSAPVEADVVIPDADLVDGSRNYVEIALATQDGTPLTKAFWDPEANSGAGAEFNQIVNTITDLKVVFVVSTGGFSGLPDRIPMAIIDVNGSGVIKVILDRRQMYGRLSTPSNIDNSYAWGTKVEPVYNLNMSSVTGTFVAGETLTIGTETAACVAGGTTSITFNTPSGISFTAGQSVTGGTSGATGTVNTIAESFTGVDKSLRGQKQINDALMTEIKAIKGKRFWWMDGPSTGGVKAEIQSVIAPISSGAKVKWTGTRLILTDDSLTPAITDNVAAIRFLSSTANLMLRRQDDGKEVTTINLSAVPTAGTLTIATGAFTTAIPFGATTAQIQTAWNSSGAYAATISGSPSVGQIVVTANAAGLQTDMTTNANTLTKSGVSVTPTYSIKQGLAADTSIAMADGDVLYVDTTSPLTSTNYSGTGVGAANYKVVARGSLAVVDTSYWLAYREGSKLIWRGVGELQTGETSQIGDNIPQGLLDAIGLVSETSMPSYTSAIRGQANESLVARASGNTDALGDAQEDRSAYIRSDSVVTWTGTQLIFSENIVLELINTKSGTITQHTVLAAGSPITLADGESAYVSIDRGIAAENVSIVLSGTTPIPAQTQSTKDIFVLFRRKDALGASYLHIPLHKQVLDPGQTVRLGASGSGDGSGGTGDDLGSLRFLASFNDTFADTDTVDKSAGKTDASLYSAASKYFRVSYDATRLATTVGTAASLSGTPSFTVKVGDILRSGVYARRITAVATQTSYTLEAAFPADLGGAAACVSQAVYSNDIRAVVLDGLSIASAISTPLTSILAFYRDSITAGDVIFDNGTPAIMAFDASSDGSSYSQVTARTTSFATDAQILSLPTSGSNLYMRFFANATSGSGQANLLDYKVFLHEDTVSTLGDTFDQASAMTDGTSAINCSIGSTSGKTIVALNFTYPLAIGSGNTQGSLQVFVDGKLIPRYVSATATPDAYYTELSNSSIQLDSDYSGLPLEVVVKRTVAVVDSTTQNVGNIAALQELLSKQGLQSFIDAQPSIAAPFTTISGRALIPDLANDCRARFGIDRNQIQQVLEVAGEIGPNGERVQAPVGSSLVRFVGPVTPTFDTTGQSVVVNTGSYAEITFYGTGLNLLTMNDGTARSVGVAVDGGSVTTITNVGSSPINSRNYAVNVVLPLVSGLALGVHTVKLSFINNPYQVYGYETIADSTFRVLPGVAYVGGKKISSVGGSTTYNAAVTGTRGGRVLTYIKSDGTIGQSFTPTAASSNFLAATDHSAEALIRSYSPREFGAGRSDDFSLLTGTSASSRSFCLEDGSTSLTANARINQFVTGQPEGLNIDSGGGSEPIVLTFTGTGLDLAYAKDAGALTDVYTVQIDGTSVGTYTPTLASEVKVVKIASGLPYGTHVVRITKASVSPDAGIYRFDVYGPAKPALPAGAIEIADHFAVADFVATTTGTDNMATGVIRKNNTRELSYNGANWTLTGAAPVNYPTGFGAQTSTAGQFVEYTFWGTGFEFRFYTDPSYTSSATITIDGSTATAANFPSAAMSVTAPATYNTSTGVLGQNVTNAGGRALRISGLTLGKHTVRITQNTGATLDVSAIDVITPTHGIQSRSPSFQNTLPIGNLSLGDTRKFSPIKSESPVKNSAQAIALTNQPSTSSTVPVPMPDMSCVIRSDTGAIRVTYSANVANSATSGIKAQIYVDGVPYGPYQYMNPSSTNVFGTLTATMRIPVSPGVHKVDVYWFATGATANAIELCRSMLVEEV